MNAEILIVTLLVSVVCSIVGVFLVLRKMSMMTDAISHTILLGIVLAYFFVSDLTSPLLIVGATVMGLVTVYLVELLVKSRLTSEDSSTGVIFPLLFSVAVIIINTKFRDTHLDLDSVLLGKLEFTIFNRLTMWGIDFGPKNIYTLLIVLSVVILVITVFFKELKITTFDPALAFTLGISTVFFHYLIMTLVSLAAVVSFDAVGSILVIALMIGPAMTALLISKSLSKSIIYAVIIAVVNSSAGYLFAYNLDFSISGTISILTLLTFFLTLVFIPDKGIIAKNIRRRRQKEDYDVFALLYHIKSHSTEIEHYKPIDIHTMNLEFAWSPLHFRRIKNILIDREYILLEDDEPRITLKGLEYVDTRITKGNGGKK